MKQNAQKPAFTLLELIIYIGIAAIVLTAAVNLVVFVGRGQARAREYQEMYVNARMVLTQMSEQIKNADGIIGGTTVFDTNPGVLALDYPGSGTDVIIETYDKEMPDGVFVKKLRIKEGAEEWLDLTSDEAGITEFTLTDFTRGSEKANIGITLGLAGDDTDISLETSVSLRK